MISKKQVKRIKALSTKKQRRLSQEFLVQGEKNVVELLNSELNIVELFATDTFITKHSHLLTGVNVTNIDAEQLSQVSTITTNHDALAIVEQPHFSIPCQLNGLVLALDDVNDPGNLGTIIRLADWYGVSDILLSERTADVYNPKTISATMGAFTRVKTHRVDLVSYLSKVTQPIYGAFLNGDSVHSCKFNTNAIIVMGNESHGISNEIEALITQKVTIPSFGASESLNVAMATGIILDNARRTLSFNH